jgi:hypothetical protein
MTQAADLLIRAPRAVTGLAAEPERPLAVAVTNSIITAVEPLHATTLTSRDTLESVSLEACGCEGYPSPGELAGAAWEPIVPARN